MPRSALNLKDSDFLKKARERFKLANDADYEQAQRERDDIAFEAGDQWPADIKLARQGQQPTNGMPAVPARPTLVINKVKEPVRQILNQERASDIGVELVPADDFGDLGITPDDTEIQLREGLVRRIQRESIAADARTWAFKRAVIAGRGYYLVMTRYLPGKTWDQEVYVHRIYNQAGVLLDPSHEAPDGSDADWGFIGTWVPWDRYKSEYAKVLKADGRGIEANPYAEYSEGDFVGLTEDYPDWYKADGENRAVRVTDYWYKERESKELALLEDGTPAWVDELPEGAKVRDTRVVTRTLIKFCKIGGGIQKLEETDWAGPDMPIIKVLGDEILPYDAERRAEGMVRNARGSQMGFNYMVSKQVEVIGLTPIPPLHVDPEAIEGYEAWYAVANTRTLPYLPSRTYDDQNRQLKEPHRAQVDPNILPIAQSIALFNQSIQDTTGLQEPSLGKTDPSVKSAKHADSLIAQSMQATGNWIDNLARSIRYEGQVINNLLYPIYGAKAGRLVRTLTGEGESETMLIADPEQQQAAAALMQRANKVAKLTKDAHFNVIVKVSKSFDSRRTELVSKLGELIGMAPEQMGVAGDILYKNMDIPEAKQLAERMRVMLAPQVQKLLQDKEQGKETDPAAQAEIAQLQEQVTLAEQAMEELRQQAEGKQIEAQSKLQIEQLKAERDIALEQLRQRTALEKARMDNATKIHVAEIAAKTKGVIQAHEQEHEALAIAMEQGHTAEQAALDRASLERQADRQDVEAERSRVFEAGENERNRQAPREEAGA